MKNIEQSIYIVIIVILIEVSSCGITYIVMKNKKSTNNKLEEKEYAPIDVE